jgi:hypothetical protein
MGTLRANRALEKIIMSSYGTKEALSYAGRLSKERKPRVNICGDCGAACDSLLCDECTKLEPVIEMERRRV